MRAALVLVISLAPALATAAEIEVTGAVIVGRAADGEPWNDGPTNARLDDDPELAVVLKAKDGKKVVYVVDDAIAPLVVGGKKVAKSARRAWSAKAKVRWSMVEPYAWRPDGVEASNGSPTPYYSNVVTGGDKHGEWLGYDQITYFETTLGKFETGADARRRSASAVPPREEDDQYGGLGTMRYKVEVEIGEETWSTAGANDTDTYGILPSVHRVSIRKDDSFRGWLGSYFQVPEVFGSAGPGRNHQSDRFTGADCADVLVGALRVGGHKVAYSHVAGLTDYADLIAGPVTVDEAGAIEGDLDGAQVGDIIRIDYGGQWANSTPRSWDHVAVWWEDKSDPHGPKKGAADGKLDGYDLVVHMGHPHLVVEALKEQAPAKIDVLRWSDKKLTKKAK